MPICGRFLSVLLDVLCGYNPVMRAVVQRVQRARVTVSGETTGEIAQGLLVLLGVGQNDTGAAADYLADKIAGLRIFEDEAGHMNRSVGEIGGAMLVVSQFTLFGDVRRGKRPSFDAAARPELARRLYEYFVDKLRATGLRCETGRFQEMMQVELVSDGPVTILLDSAKGFQDPPHSRCVPREAKTCSLLLASSSSFRKLTISLEINFMAMV